MKILFIILLLLSIFLAFCGYYLSSELDKYKQENNKLNELLSVPVPIIKETKYKVQTFCVERRISEPEMFYRDTENVKKQLTRDLAESLVSTGFVEFIEVNEPGIGEMVIARIDVVQK